MEENFTTIQIEALNNGKDMGRQFNLRSTEDEAV